MVLFWHKVMSIVKKTIWCKISDCICIHPLFFKVADLIQLLGADPSRHSSRGGVHPWQDASSSQGLHMGTNNHLCSHLHLWQFRLTDEPHLHVFLLWDEARVPRGNTCRHGRTCSLCIERHCPSQISEDILTVKQQGEPLSLCAAVLNLQKSEVIVSVICT